MKKIINILMMSVFCAFSQQVFASAGDLDTSFSNDGIVTYQYQSFYSPLSNTVASAVQTDGKIVFASQGQILVPGGSTDGLIVIRYNTDGSFDNTFGTAGIVRTNIGNFESVGKVIVQPDGKIIVSGDRYAGETAVDFALVRYNSNGSLDNSFDGNGVAVANFTGVSNDFGESAVLQTDGKIVVVGLTDNQTEYQSFDWAVARFNTDGSLDSTFDGDGKLIIPFGSNNEAASSVDSQPDGKIVISGVSSNGANNDFTTVRLNSDGSFDQGFGSNGIVKTLIGNSNESINAVKILPNNKILAAGGTANSTNNDIAVVRYDENGSLDMSFGNGGIVTASFTANSSETAFDLALQSDGKFLVSSSSGSSAGIIRFNADGSLDNSFGTNGKVTTLVFNFASASAFSLIIQPDQKIVVSGSTIPNGSGGSLYFFTARYLNAASHKNLFDFDGDGRADVSVFRPLNGAWYLQQSTAGFTGLQFGVSTDKIVPADYDGDGKTDVAVYRGGTWYLQRSQLGFTGAAFGDPNDVPVPADYDGDGKADLAVFRPSNGVWYLQKSNLGFTGIQFGQTGDKPVAADYDGDGKADIAVNRNGTWYIQRSQLGFTGVSFGDFNDKLVPADYDGDGKADVAVFRPSNGTWYLQQSTAGFTGIAFGVGTDLPTAADYDGDGKADLAVFRDGTWYLQRSTQGFTGVAFGVATDKPIPNAFVQ